MTVSAMNFKPFERGSMRGFFDLRYHGLTIKGCRLMESNGGHWVALPQKEIEHDGERKWVDLMELTRAEADHVHKLVVADLESQGHIARPARQERPQGKPRPTPRPAARPTRRTPDGEDMTPYYTPDEGLEDDIPF